MAMYPNATRGYMPFVTPANKRSSAKKSAKSEKQLFSSKSRGSGDTKTYRVTLRDRNGYTYQYIIQADGTKSLPVLCESKVTGPNGFSSSLPNLAEAALTGKRAIPVKSSDRKKDGEKKTGLLESLLNFLGRKKPADASKSKRKPKVMLQRKRQRTISAMSNLDPIQESPEEDSEEDNDSYSHDSTGSETDSVAENEP